MKKKILILLTLIVVTAMTIAALSPKDVYGDSEYVESDMGGVTPSSDSGSPGGGGSGYSSSPPIYALKASSMIRVSLVNITGENPVTEAQRYYQLDPDANADANSYHSFFVQDNYNDEGAYTVCIATNNLGSKCVEVNQDYEYSLVDEAWFLNFYKTATPNAFPERGGLNYHAINAKEYLTKNNAQMFENIVNELRTSDGSYIIKEIIGKNLDFNTLETEDKKNLRDYRLIIEPVYIFSICGLGHNCDPITGDWKHINATIKGMAAYVLKKDSEYPNLSIAKKNLSIHAAFFAQNAVATSVHGSINRDIKYTWLDGLEGYPVFLEAEQYPEYYRALANINEGHGYGILTIVGGCNPKIECCYDSSGKYQESFSGIESNYKCSNPDEEQCSATLTKCTGETPTCGSSTGDITKNLECTSEKYEGKLSEQVVVTRELEDTTTGEYNWYKKEYSGSCSATITEEIIGNITINQESKDSETYFNLTPQNVISGTGFQFSAKYKSETTYELCEDIVYKVIEEKEENYCPVLSNIVITTSYEKETTEPDENNICYYNEVIEESGKEPIENEYSISVSEGTSSCPSIKTITWIKEYASGSINGNKCNYNYQITKTININEEEKENNTYSCFRIDGSEPNFICHIIDPNAEANNGTEEKDNLITRCVTAEIKEYSCNPKSHQYLAYNCSAGNETEEMKKFAKEMMTYVEEPTMNINTYSEDSNVVSTTYSDTPWGEWKSKIYMSSGDELGDYWYPGEKIIYELEFFPDKACISANTGKVTYREPSQTCLQNEKDGGYIYYTPLKEPDSSYFPIKVEASELSIINGMNWILTYKCGVTCQQELFTTNGEFKYVYRPIDMKNPFPNRNPGSNWINFMNDENAKSKKLNRKQENLEYEIRLDQADIQAIKNDNSLSSYSHTSFDNILENGKSTYTYVEQARKNNVTYNKLGECTNDNECWGGS